MENVIQIMIKDCPNCLRLLPLGALPRLEKLKLDSLAVLEYMIENEAVQGGDHHHQVKKDAILIPSLEFLELKSLPNLKGLLKEEMEAKVVFSKFRRLYIENCPMLKLTAVSSLQELGAHGCNNLNLNSFSKLRNLTFLSVGFDDDITTCITKETLGNLSNLKKLVLQNTKEHNLPIEEEGLQGLNSLKELVIHDCDTLKCLPDRWFRHLTSLEKLRIFNCNELVELPVEGMKSLRSSLKNLLLYDLPKMKGCIPEAIQHLSPSLQSLDLHNFHEVASLPDWLGNFTSLRDLFIIDCPRLTLLPASIKGMTNLKTLSISPSPGGEVNPELKRRCEKGKGEDWHLISHIPDLRIDRAQY